MAEGTDIIHDVFCWVCSKRGTSLECSNCERTYHKKCIPPVKIIEVDGVRTNWVCNECAGFDSDVFK